MNIILSRSVYGSLAENHPNHEEVFLIKKFESTEMLLLWKTSDSSTEEAA
jgi:hypothetical protein